MEAVASMSLSKREEFGGLVREHHRELLVYARALTREEHQSRDVVQDSFVVAWENLGKFDVTRDFGSWMRGIVRNKWREQMRRNKRQVALDDNVLESMEAEMLGWDELRRDGGPGVFVKLEGCLGKLPDGLMAVVRRFYFDGESSDEAAEGLGVSGSALRKRLERARGALRECLGK